MKLSIDVTRIPGLAIAALGAVTALSVQPNTTDFLSSLCITVSGLLLTFDDVHELGLRRDPKVVAHLAKASDGARVRQIGNALNLPDRTVARSLNRLAADGLVVRATEGESLPMRSYRLAD
ncbi:hypothetical protein [Kitasatospora sp. NPDC050463]|uniref:hypothetical protein n=1 Tax=Kitasatospora sp. NPDC050463 TaxID=3155786 RepID=UPI0033E6F34D